MKASVKAKQMQRGEVLLHILHHHQHPLSPSHRGPRRQPEVMLPAHRCVQSVLSGYIVYASHWSPFAPSVIAVPA